jgi:hypothetical protein
VMTIIIATLSSAAEGVQDVLAPEEEAMNDQGANLTMKISEMMDATTCYYLWSCLQQHWP